MTVQIVFSKADRIIAARHFDRLQNAEMLRQAAVSVATAAYDGTPDAYPAFAAATAAADAAKKAAVQESVRLREQDVAAVRSAVAAFGPGNLDDADGANTLIAALGVAAFADVVTV